MLTFGLGKNPYERGHTVWPIPCGPYHTGTEVVMEVLSFIYEVVSIKSKVRIRVLKFQLLVIKS